MKHIKVNISVQPVKNWRYFDDFYVLPTIYLATINTYSAFSKYQFTRFIDVLWLWFGLSIQWEYKRIK